MPIASHVRKKLRTCMFSIIRIKALTFESIRKSPQSTMINWEKRRKGCNRWSGQIGLEVATHLSKLELTPYVLPCMLDGYGLLVQSKFPADLVIMCTARLPAIVLR